MNTRQLVEDETERGTPEAPWRSQKRKRTSSWYQRPPDAITSRVWSVVNRPLVQPLSLPYVTASRRSLSLSLFSSSRSSSFYLPSESPSRSVCLPSPAKFRQLPPRHLVFLSKVHSSRRVCRIKGEGEATRNIVRETSQVKLNGEELIAARWWSVEFLERGAVWEWMLLLSTREGNSNSLEEGDQRCSFCASCFVVLYIYYIKNYILENVCFYCYEFWIGWLYFYWFNKDILLFYRQVSSFFLLR